MKIAKFNFFLKLMNTPTSRYFLRKLTNKKTKSGKNLLEEYLYCYFSGVVTDDMKSFMNYKTKMFGLGMDVVGKSLFGKKIRCQGMKDAQSMLIVLKTIGFYGLKKPFFLINPLMVVWNITNKCNLRCKQCYQNSSDEGNELTLDEKFYVVDRIAESGAIYINFAGGEPLLSKDFFKVVEYSINKGLMVKILTNGTLITKEVAKKFSEMGIDLVVVSIDGAKKETHDKIRGVRGSYEKAIEGVKNCVKENIKTGIAMTLNADNYQEVSELIQLSKNLGAKYFFVKPFIPAGRGAKYSYLDLSPEVKNEVFKKIAMEVVANNDMIINVDVPQFRCLFEESCSSTGLVLTDIGIIKESENGIKFIESGCRAGSCSIILEPNGDIKPCLYMDIILGNVRKDKIKDIWNNSEVFKTLRSRENLKGNCGSCKDKYVCGGCRASAYNYFKDLTAPDPGCIKNIKYWEEIKNKV